VKIKKMDHLYKPIVWIDLETTGLDEKKDVILEVFVAVTDGMLEYYEEGPNIQIMYEDLDQRIEGMEEWPKKMHTKSGLLEKCKQSKYTLEETETQICMFLENVLDPSHWHGKRRDVPVAGNSVHFDVSFLKKYMPNTLKYTSHRIIDVSTINECAKRLRPDLLPHLPRKYYRHTARSDILESINELRFYNKYFFISQINTSPAAAIFSPAVLYSSAYVSPSQLLNKSNDYDNNTNRRDDTVYYYSHNEEIVKNKGNDGKKIPPLIEEE
jgi:oligoribonuclease